MRIAINFQFMVGEEASGREYEVMLTHAPREHDLGSTVQIFDRTSDWGAAFRLGALGGFRIVLVPLSLITVQANRYTTALFSCYYGKEALGTAFEAAAKIAFMDRLETGGLP
jgi:hypothetical protein